MNSRIDTKSPALRSLRNGSCINHSQNQMFWGEVIQTILLQSESFLKIVHTINSCSSQQASFIVFNLFSIFQSMTLTLSHKFR